MIPQGQVLNFRVCMIAWVHFFPFLIEHVRFARVLSAAAAVMSCSGDTYSKSMFPASGCHFPNREGDTPLPLRM